jgi:hypothetical protein
MVPGTPPPAEVKIPNFTSCSIVELQKTILELKHLKASPDQSQLSALLDKIETKTVDIARRTPNLVSDESVISDRGGIKTLQNFSFLVLQHVSPSNAIVLDEFRVDAKSGEKFQTEALEKAAEANAPPSDPSSPVLPSGTSQPRSGGAPPSQGFVNEWLNFYPSNRIQAEFRYLGQQTLDRRQTLVVAFAQKLAFVRFPAIVTYHDKLYKIFRQGVVWVDATDFRIVRLRTDILSPPPGVTSAPVNFRHSVCGSACSGNRVATLAAARRRGHFELRWRNPPRDPLLFTLPPVSHEIEAPAESVGSAVEEPAVHHHGIAAITLQQPVDLSDLVKGIHRRT